MRISGVVLVVLVLGHLFIMNILDGGVQRINSAFVAGRWASPVLAGLGPADAVAGHAPRHQRPAHDHQRLHPPRRTRFWLKALLYTATTITIALGTLVIFTFDPTL